jgi:hypothetical protein
LPGIELHGKPQLLESVVAVVARSSDLEHL